jgi:hypothetical protein
MSSELTIPAVTNQGVPLLSDEEIDRLNIWYEEGCGYQVWNGSAFVEMNENGLKQYLKTRDICTKTNGKASQMDHVLTQIRLRKNVKYVGELAGKSAGLHTENGRQMLIIGRPELIKPDAAVEWSLLREFIEGLFAPGGGVQVSHFYSWLKISLEAVENRKWSPGQVVAVAGPPGCGKTLMQMIVGLLLGGRVANPFAYISGATSFNRDLFRCETLNMGDEISSTDIRTRRTIGARLKQMTVNEDQNCHGKGREGLTLRPQWRICISLNDEPENLLVLPPMDASIADKIMLFRVQRPQLLDDPSRWTNNREVDWRAIRDGLPGLVAFLHAWEVPADIREGRFGVKAYHDPDIMVALSELSPEARLLDLIDMSTLLTDNLVTERTTTSGGYVENTFANYWEGSALELEQYLCGDNQPKHIAESCKRLITHNNAIASYLGRTSKQRPERVKALARHGRTVWRIFKPSRTEG